MIGIAQQCPSVRLLGAHVYIRHVYDRINKTMPSIIYYMYTSITLY